MNRRLKLAIISCGIALSVLFPQVSQARAVEQEIKKTGVLKVGIREDSPLFGFSSEKVGYCTDFANSLAENLSQKLGKTIKVKGTASFLEINPEKYTLVTPLINNRPLCAAYGMILPEGQENTQWHNTVNSWIAKSGQGERVWENWFQEFLPYVGDVLEACQTSKANNENFRESTQLETL